VPIRLFLTALDSALEPLLVLVIPLEFDFAGVLAVEASVDNLVVDLALLRLHLLVQINRSFRRQKRTLRKLLQERTLVLFIVGFLESLSALRATIALFELFFIVDLKDGIVDILIELLGCVPSCAALALALGAGEFGLNFVLEVIIHDELGLAGLLDEPRGGFLVGHLAMVRLLQICRRLHHLTHHFQMLILHIKHADLAHVFLEDGGERLEVALIFWSQERQRLA